MESRVSLSDRGLQKVEFSRIGVEPGPHAQGKGPLSIDMPDRKAVGYGNAKRSEIGVEHLVKTECTVAAGPLQPGEPADHHPSQAAKRTDQAKVRKHTVNPVEVFAHILEEQYGAGELWKVGRADQALKQGEVPAG